MFWHQQLSLPSLPMIFHSIQKSENHTKTFIWPFCVYLSGFIQHNPFT